jgi:uncharacterized surface protein with fasciclin (FAS1) repeats
MQNWSKVVPGKKSFAKLPAGTGADLIKPEILGTLHNILLYLGLAGKAMAADVKKRAGFAGSW